MRRFATIVVAAALVVAGCGNGDDGSTGGPPPSATTGTSASTDSEDSTNGGGGSHALRPTYPAGEFFTQAGLELGPHGSRLAGDPSTGCVWFEGIGNDARVSTIWPEGFSVSFNPLRVYDREGRVFAEEGKTYTLLGGNEEPDPTSECRQDPSVSVVSWRVGQVSAAPDQ